MKKIIGLLLVFVLCNVQVFSQTITKEISQQRIGSVDCNYYMSIEIPASDTTYYIFCSFQNMKYSSITDIGGFVISTKIELDKIIGDLKECVKYIDNQSIGFSTGDFVIPSSSKDLYLYDRRGNFDKFTTLSKNKVLKWISWLDSIKVISKLK